MPTRSAFSFAKHGLSLALMLNLFFIPGCKTPVGGDWSSAVGNEWVLKQLDGKRPMVNSRVTLTFADDGRAVGHAGVNRYFSTYELVEIGQLRFAAIGSTRMYRDKPEGLMEQENRYLELLSEVDSYHLRRNRLFMLKDGKRLLQFEPANID